MEVLETSKSTKLLTKEEKLKLDKQDTRLVSEFKSKQLENDAKKYWDLFYKRNETRFFKDRHWTTREFSELLNNENGSSTKRVIFEVGCGVGNFIYPLIEEKLNINIYACDLSPIAVEILQKNPLYNTEKMKVFQCDITTEGIFEIVSENEIDIVTLIFVLSAIHPEKFLKTLKNLYKILKPGGVLLFRDYGLHDMAQLRFRAGHKISENFYMRQDGTRSYYFSIEFMEELFLAAGFKVLENCYIHRRTINKKENIDVPRIFLQSKVIKTL